MNERIKLLAEQAGFHFNEYNETTQRKAENLAELIIFECMKLAVFNGDTKTGRIIKEHFGVK